MEISAPRQILGSPGSLPETSARTPPPPPKFREVPPGLDGPAIRNANRGDSRESIRRKTIRRKTLSYFHNVRAIRANRLKPEIRTF